MTYNVSMGIGSTEARKRAHDKYQAEKVDVIYVRVPKGKKEVIQEHANKKGISVNSLINALLDDELKNKK